MARSSAKGRRGGDADPIDMLKEDHQKVKDLLKQYESAGENAHKKKQSIAEKVFTELEVHASLEEEIFYPAVRESGDEEAGKLVAEAVEEHRVVKTLIDELRDLEPEDEQFDAKFKVMAENVEHHADEEEQEMFPVAEDALGDRMEEIGRQMQSRKKELMREQAA
jgi:hemerythrin-like domain-containing protein